jgi:hypothetical protein
MYILYKLGRAIEVRKALGEVYCVVFVSQSGHNGKNALLYTGQFGR